MMAQHGMIDWRMVSKAASIEPDPKILAPLQALEAQYREIERKVELETEPAIFYVLPFPEEQ
jgi:hypothetical protein